MTVLPQAPAYYPPVGFGPVIETARTLLRPWSINDAPFFAQLHADRLVRHFFYPDVLDSKAAYEALDWIVSHWRQHGFGFFAVERKQDRTLIGGAGLSVLVNAGPSTPARVEIGWIFSPAVWGQGLAIEAAGAALQHGWTRTDIEEVVAYMTRENLRSRRLAERLGMTSDPADDFEDDTVPLGHWQRPHVLYRIRRQSHGETAKRPSTQR